MEKPILAWVNCYGAWAPDLRHATETMGYSQYLDGVANAIACLGDMVAAVYLSGGMYDAKDRTECETTAPELLRRLKAAGSPVTTITADEASVTSIAIARTFLQVWQSDHKDKTPVLFCDEARYGTNAYVLEELAKELHIDLTPVVEVLFPVRRVDVHPNSSPAKQAEKLEVMKREGIAAVEAKEMEARQEHVAKKTPGTPFRTFSL